MSRWYSPQDHSEYSRSSLLIGVHLRKDCCLLRHAAAALLATRNLRAAQGFARSAMQCQDDRANHDGPIKPGQPKSRSLRAQQSPRVASTVQDADDDNGIRKRPIVDRIRTIKGDPQPRPKLLPGRRRQREMSHRFKCRLDRREKPRRHQLRRLCGDVSPDLGEVRLSKPLSAGTRAAR